MSFSPTDHGSQSPELEISMPSIRMKLDNTFATMQDGIKSSNMKVFARVRPMLQREEDAGYRECVAVIDEQVVRAIVPASSMKFKNLSQNGQEIYEDFTYTEAFGPETGQFPFFRHTIMDIMTGFIEGQNCLIFSYGITNSGKTFTLQGDEANPGIIPLAMRLFFASIKHQLLEGISVKPDKFADILMLSDKESSSESQLKEQLIQLSEQEAANKSNASGSQKTFASTLCDVCFNDDVEFETETTLPPEEMQAAQSALLMKELSKQSADQQEGLCSIWISFVEIYNEYIYDLLQPIISNRAKLMLAEDQNGDVYVKGAREICISSSEEAIKLLNLGRRNLRIASTKLNYQSSRSHCIFTVKVVRLYDENNGRVNRISFCDLAGSERAAKSKTTGIHLKEAGYINTSLLVLGKCLEQLRLNQSLRDKKMIPLRESKLTRLFSGHFLGKGKTVMIANASPCEYTFDETLNVLRFSALLKTVKLNDSYMSAASCSLQNITNQWAKSKSHISEVSLDQSSDFDNSMWEDMQEKDQMIEKLLDLADSLRNNLEKEKREKAQLEVTIRQDVCREYSEYSDELIENQKRIAAEYVEALTAIHEKKMENLEAKYERQIAELKLQLEEYDSCTDESSMSINKGNITLNNEDAETSKILFDSPMTIPKTAEKQISTDSPTAVHPVESKPSDYLNYIEEIKSLQADLSSVTRELEVTKEQLEQACEKVKEAQTDAASAKEECVSLSQKLQNAEEISLECSKDLNALKAESIKKDEAIETLMKEKRDLEENILFSCDERAVVAAEIEQLKKEKADAEEQFAQQSKQFQQKISDAMQEFDNLRIKLDKTSGDLVEAESKYEKLESECENLKNHNSKLSGDCKALEDKLVQLVKTQSEAIDKHKELEKAEKMIDSYKEENLKLIENIKTLEEQIVLAPKQSDIDEAELKSQDMTKELEILNKTIQDQETKINQLEKDYAALKHLNIELSANFEIEKDKYTALLAEHDSNKTDLKCQELENQLEEVNKIIKDQASKINKLEDDCAILSVKNTELSASYNIEKEKCITLSDEHDNASVQIKHLEKELSEAMNADLETINDLKLEKEIVQEKFNELLPKFEEQSSKILKLEQDCSEYQLEKEQHLKTIKKYEESAISVKNLEITTSKRLSEFGLELESTSQELKEQKIKNTVLEEKSSDLFLQLEKSLQDLDERNVKINELRIKSEEINKQMENSTQEISDLKLKVDELESECATHKNNHADLLEDYISLEGKFADMKEKLETGDGSDLKSQLDELQTERDMFKRNYDKVFENYQTLDAAFTALSKDIGSLRVDHEKLKQEKLDIADAYAKSVEELKIKEESSSKDIEELSNALNEARTKITKYEEEVSQLRSEYTLLKEKYSLLEAEHIVLQGVESSKKAVEDKLNEAQEKIKEYENEVLQLRAECSALKEKFSDLETDNVTLQGVESSKKEIEIKLNETLNKIKVLENEVLELNTECSAFKEKCSKLEAENIALKGAESSKQIMEEQPIQLNEAQQKIKECEGEISQLIAESSSLKAKFSELETENVALQAKLQDIEEKNVRDTNEFTTKITELEQNVSTNKDCIKKLRESNEILEKYKADIADYQLEISSAKEEIVNLKRELQKAKLLQEQSDELCQAVEKCEWLASNKVKLLQASAIPPEDIADLKRQIREKSNSIAELEKALCARQKQVKEMDAKLTEQVTARKKDSALIEQLQHEKKLQNAEISKIKIDLQQSKTKLNEKQKDVNEKVNKKRSLSDANKDSEENPVNKDNLDSKNRISENKVKVVSKKQDDESEVLSKRRRVLRSKQTKNEEPIDDSFEIKVPIDDDYEPAKKTVGRKKKTATKELPPPKARVSRKKLQEQENMSPVKKAMQFMGSKIMSVAQSVSSMPSPRVTRGRKKLFNADAEPKKAEPKWKI